MLVNQQQSVSEEIDALGPRPKKRRAAPEAGLQKAILQYCLWRGIFAHHSPNEGKRTAITGRRMKAEGMRSGYPDLTCVGRGNVLFLELKAPGGVLSDAQKQCHANMRRAGARLAVVRSVEEAEIAFRDAGLLP